MNVNKDYRMKNLKKCKDNSSYRRSWGGGGRGGGEGGIWFRLGFRRTNTTARPQLIYVHEIMGDLQQGGGGGLGAYIQWGRL